MGTNIYQYDKYWFLSEHTHLSKVIKVLLLTLLLCFQKAKQFIWLIKLHIQQSFATYCAKAISNSLNLKQFICLNKLHIHKHFATYFSTAITHYLKQNNLSV